MCVCVCVRIKWLGASVLNIRQLLKTKQNFQELLQEAKNMMFFSGCVFCSLITDLDLLHPG